MDSLDRIDQLLEILEIELDRYDTLVEEKTRTEADYKLAKAKKWMEAKLDSDLKTVGDKEAFIDSELEEPFFAYRLAEGKLDAHKERVRTLRAMLSALQTLSTAGRV